jgi:diacylglycerol diphosphate phosphatase/phosphatidate phosphatase
MIAISRLADYRHDVYDVTCGSLLGLFIAYFSYRRYYPSLCSIECDTPYSRSDFAIIEGFRRIAVDEEQVTYDSATASGEIDNLEDAYPMCEINPGRGRGPWCHWQE